MAIHSIDSPIEGRNDSRGKPGAVTHFDVELNSRQQRLLDALPGYDSRVSVRKEDVSMTDLSALTAKTGDEFALFTKGGVLILRQFHQRGSTIYNSVGNHLEFWNYGQEE